MQNTRSKGKNSRILVAAIATGTRTAPATSTVTVATGGAAQNATSIPVSALTAAIPANTVLSFTGGKRAVVSAAAAASATSLTVEALAEALTAGNEATYDGLTRVMGITTSTPSYNPQTQTLGGTTYESSESMQWQDVDVPSSSWSINCSAEIDVDDPGYLIVKNAAKAGSEVWVKRESLRDDLTVAEYIEGAALISGWQRPDPADNVKTASWTFQGQGEPTDTHVAAS